MDEVTEAAAPLFPPEVCALFASLLGYRGGEVRVEDATEAAAPLFPPEVRAPSA